MEIIVSKRFRKQARILVQNRKNLKERLNRAIQELSEKGKKAGCYCKALKGNWYGYDELQLGGDLRIIARFHQSSERVILESIGTHSQLGFS